MRPRASIQRRIWIALAGCAIAAFVAFAFIADWHNPSRGLPYFDSFAAGTADEWKVFGGTWSVYNGAMRNDSDERGAKLMSGSPYWTNYSIDADVKLLGEDGDAGLVIRADDEELGVDSYSGYYAGLRTRDNLLVLGRANHGWKQLKAAPIPPSVQPFRWYHLRLLAYGCQIVASATFPLNSANTTTVADVDKDCLRSGRIGLRSYSSGGIWRNVSVRPASLSDLRAVLAGHVDRPPAAGGSLGQNIFGSGSLPSRVEPSAPLPETAVQSIGSLRLASSSHASLSTIRGVVALTTPVLFVQDSTGGVAVLPASSPPLKVGDEVQVTGTVEARAFSSTLHHATVWLLWARTPIPPLSVTASQAASGSFDAIFIEVEGYLREKKLGSANTLVLKLQDGQQSFNAIVDEGHSNLLFRKLRLNSRLRLRGICVVNPRYTRNLTPFVLLLQSTDGIDVLAGPPWWNTLHVVEICFFLLVFVFLGYFIYSRVERWKLHAILEERQRLAHEMHDTLAQSFAGLGFQLQAIRNRMPENIPALHQQLDIACDLVRHSHQEARRSIANLRPESSVPGDLLSSLELCVRNMVDGGTVEVQTVRTGDPRMIPARISNPLFRIGQESLANSVRHARPSRICISLDFARDAVRLTIEDDGTGFISGREASGFGIQGMRRRAAAISAAFHIASAPGQGARVLVTAPLPRRPALHTWPTHLWQRFRGYVSHA